MAHLADSTRRHRPERCYEACGFHPARVRSDNAHGSGSFGTRTPRVRSGMPPRAELVRLPPVARVSLAHVATKASPPADPPRSGSFGFPGARVRLASPTTAPAPPAESSRVDEAQAPARRAPWFLMGHPDVRSKNGLTSLHDHRNFGQPQCVLLRSSWGVVKCALTMCR